MNLQPFYRRRTAKKGSVLIIAVGLMVFITAIFFIVSSYESQMLQNSQLKLAAKNASLAQSSILQALRAATYLQYMNDYNQSTTPTGTFTFSTTDYASILTQVGTMLTAPGTPIPITSGTAFSLPQDSGGTLTVTITSPPTAQPMGKNDIQPPASATYTIYNSGTWLDGTPALTAYLPFTITINATPIVGVGGSPYSITTQRSIIMARVSPSAMALAAEGDAQLGSAATIAGNASVAGTIFGSGNVASGNVVSGTIDASDTTTQAGAQLNRNIVGTGYNAAGFDFRAVDEILEASAANPGNLSKQSSLQRVDYMVRAIPTNFLFREGMYGSTTIPSADQNLYKNAQPFYSTTSVNYRVWGIYGTSGTSGTFTPSSASIGGSSMLGSTPIWLSTTPYRLVYQGSTPYLALYLDIQNLLNAAESAGDLNPSKPLVVFVAGSDGTAPASTGTGSNFSHMILILNACASLVSAAPATAGVYPSNLTIISPNQVVYNGNINQPASANTTFTVISPTVSFGLGGSATATFSGQIQGKTQVSNEVALMSGGFTLSPSAGTTVSGTGGAATLTTNAESATAMTNEPAGQSLYIALIQQQ